MKRFLLALATAASFGAPLAAAPSRPATPPPSGEEVSIPFVHFGGIWNFDAQDDDVVYLQDRHRNWYRAQLYGPCFGLVGANAIGVDTRGSANFDRFATLIVGNESCPIESLTRSSPPPPRHHKKKG